MAFYPTEEEAARFRDHRCYRRLGWFECAGHSRSRKTDWSLRKHAPQSGNAPTSHYQGSCQSRENHRNRWPGTTPCSSGSFANWVYSSQVQWKLGSWVDFDPFKVPSDQGATPQSVRVAEAPSFVTKKLKMAHILDQGDESEFTLADAGHITVWFHNFVAITHGQPDERAIIGIERESDRPTGFPLRRFRPFHTLRAENNQSSPFHRLPASAGRLLVGERNLWSRQFSSLLHC